MQRNNKVKTVTTVLLCLALAVAADAAPTRNQPPSGFNSYLMSGLQKASFGLLDPSKMNIQNSASFGAAFGGGGSLMQSLYTTRIG